MVTFSWLTKSAAVAQLRARLYNSAFWDDTECWNYIVEGLRIWNAFTEQWNVDLPITNASGAWLNVPTLPNSPRVRTVTSNDLFTQMEYMLLEPPSGGTWTGTTQFAISDLQNNLQSRLQEVIQATTSNLGLVTLNYTPVTRRLFFDDNVLQPRRVRFLSLVANTTASGTSGSTMVTVASGTGIAAGQLAMGDNILDGTFVLAISGLNVLLSQPISGDLAATPVQFFFPNTLTREDTQAFQWYSPDYLQTNDLPKSWSMASEAPLAIDTDFAPNTAGLYEVIVLESGPVIAAPAAALLGLPDDWSWLPMYSALADSLSRAPEASDRFRAGYCMERYSLGLETMRNANWMTQAQVNGVACDTPSLAEKDDYFPEWQASSLNLPCVVTAGMDFAAPAPSFGQSVLLDLVGNAPLLDTDFVQVARDDWNAVLNYAHHVATFKMAGQDFIKTYPLLQDFYRAAAAVNKRLMSYGIFVDVLRQAGTRQERIEVR